MKPLNIFGRKVKVNLVESLVENQGNLGTYCYDKKEIDLEATLKPKELIEVLVHEAVHAMFDRTGVHQNLAEGVEEIITEQIVTVLTENFKITLR